MALSKSQSEQLGSAAEKRMHGYALLGARLALETTAEHILHEERPPLHAAKRTPCQF